MSIGDEMAQELDDADLARVTGQVDEAGRGRERVNLLARSRRLMARTALLEAETEQLQDRAHRIANENASLRADRDRLAGQVAAIGALCDEEEAACIEQGQRDRCDYTAQLSTETIRAALVASTPTTPEGNQP